MAGIKIPIGGDLGPLREAIEKIRGYFKRLASQIGAALRPLKAIATSVFNGMANAARAAARTIKSVFAGLGKMMGLGGLIGGAGAGLLAANAVKQGSDLAGEFERTSLALTALTGSGEEATRVLNAMKATWESTGVTVAEQAKTIQKFIALGFSADQALQLQSNILDIAGAVGMTTSEAELLGSALAQVKAKGVVSMEELRQQIAEKGVPVFDALSQRLGVTQAELMKLVEGGKVPADELLSIFMNMEGAFGKFKGGATQMGSTFAGMVARMKGVWAMLMADFAKPINDALKPMLAAAMDFMKSMKERAASMGKAVGDALMGAFALIRSGRTMELLGRGLNLAFKAAVDVLYRGFQGVLAFIATALPPVLNAAFAKLSDPKFWSGVRDMLEAAGHSMASAIHEALGMSKAAIDERNRADTYAGRGESSMRHAGKVDFTAILVEALKDGGQAFANQFQGESRGVKEARVAVQQMFRDVAREVEAMKAKYATPSRPAAAPGAGEGGKGGGQRSDPSGLAYVIGNSLARIGGGRGMTLFPMVKEQQRTNATLTKIERNTRNPGGTKLAATYG